MEGELGYSRQGKTGAGNARQHILAVPDNEKKTLSLDK
jgi:hypothetical protein